MQSSFNVIKNRSVLSKGDMKIVTAFDKTVDNNGEESLNVNSKEVTEKEEKSINESYETLAAIMLEGARKQREDILSKTFEEAQTIQREAYENGFNKGNEEGYAAGYEKSIADAEYEANQITENAKNILFQANHEASSFLENKKEEFINLIVEIAENVISKELSSKDGLNELIYNAIAYYKNFETIIIRINNHHIEEVRTKIDYWKESLGLKVDLFLIEDNSIQIGNALIEKNNGKVIVGIDVSLESIKEAIL